MGKQITDKNSPEKMFLKRSNVVLGTDRVHAFMLHAASLYQSKRGLFLTVYSIQINGTIEIYFMI